MCYLCCLLNCGEVLKNIVPVFSQDIFQLLNGSRRASFMYNKSSSRILGMLNSIHGASLDAVLARIPGHCIRLISSLSYQYVSHMYQFLISYVIHSRISDTSVFLSGCALSSITKQFRPTMTVKGTHDLEQNVCNIAAMQHYLT